MLQVLLTWIPEKISPRMGSDLIRRKRRKDVTGKKLPSSYLQQNSQETIKENEAQMVYIYADQYICISDLQKRIDHTLNKR
jgi:hypothetical protein